MSGNQEEFDLYRPAHLPHSNYYATDPRLSRRIFGPRRKWPVLDESSGRWLAGSHASIGRHFSEWLSAGEGVCQHVAVGELERAAGGQATGKAGDLHGAVG